MRPFHAAEDRDDLLRGCLEHSLDVTVEDMLQHIELARIKKGCAGVFPRLLTANVEWTEFGLKAAIWA